MQPSDFIDEKYFRYEHFGGGFFWEKKKKNTAEKLLPNGKKLVRYRDWSNGRNH